MNISPNKIILGSAFCPPTIGHHAIVNALRTIENIDTIRLVPSGPRIDKVYALHNDIRRKLIEVFVSEFDDPRISRTLLFLIAVSKLLLLEWINTTERKTEYHRFRFLAQMLSKLWKLGPILPKIGDIFWNRCRRYFSVVVV